MNKKLILLAISAMGTFASCTKEDVTPTPTPTPTTPVSSGAATPTYATGDGAIVALMTRTTTTTPFGSTDFDLGTGVAVFGNLSTGTYSDAGKITLNGTELAKQTNNSYLYTPGATNPTGIDLSGNITWVVTTPSFTYNAGGSVGRGMPIADKMAGTYTSVSSSTDFTLAVDGSISNADSVYFQINGSKKSLLKRMAGTVKSVTFTAAEMGTLGAVTGGSVTICPWNHELKTLGGKSIHVINELALSRVVEIK
ncbi:MAG: hypothetical protein V4561_10840 [Bacteroidota bacterium]